MVGQHVSVVWMIVLIFPTASGLLCGIHQYNDGIQVCCNGELSPLMQKKDGKNQIMSCCQGQLINKATELCCGPQIGVPKIYTHNGKEYERKCCEHSGQIAEPHKGENCCNGHLVMKDNNTECCGNQTYSRTREFCCEIVAEQKFQIYPSPDDGKSTCCGLKKYNADEFKCFKKQNYTVSPIDEKRCGTRPYDEEKEICCYEETTMQRPEFQPPDQYAVPPDYKCREKIIYDSNHEQFVPTNIRLNIKAHVYPKNNKPCGNSSYNPKPVDHQEFCCDLTVRNATTAANVACCGTELYNKDREQCCNRRIVDQTKGCCNGVIYTKGVQECCGNRQLIDPHNQICCSEFSSYPTFINKTYKNDTDCCVLNSGARVPFNKWSKPLLECKNGKLQPKPCVDGKKGNGKKICCGDQLIDRRRTGCCVLNNGVSTPFNRFQHVCYNGELQPTRLFPKKLVPKPCPFSKARKVKQMKRTCDRKKEFLVRVVNATIDGNGTTLAITILLPLDFYNHSMEVQIPYQCRCIKASKVFTIFTNRRLQRRESARLTKKDMIMMYTNDNYKLRHIACTLQKKFTRRTRKRLRG